ncbi:LicD family protein [uncultured Anaerofustis sp.]|uniref:LicD family protein n=1 Tax=uncultured Anaerofustis sp. TaxID=904996 RepID=UPI0025E3213B|nr:LicD family protein [uncultured Anaerofustis sp.]
MTLSKKDQVLNVIRKIQLEALAEIDRICRKHNINYSLGGGTCLGAIRHKGYIPWDDDIDIDMDRKEFEKFLEVSKYELNEDKYHLQCIENDPEFYSFTPRLMIKNTILNNKSMELSGNNHCIFIDIFIHDYLPNNKLKRAFFSKQIYWTKVLTYYKWYGITNHVPQSFKAMAKKFVDKKDYNYFLKKFDKYAKYYYKRNKTTDFIIDTSIVNGNFGGFPASIKNEYIDVPFENLTVKCLKDYDTFLKILYGNNYMEIFPREKRTSHHKWKRVDLGPYAEKYGLPKEYVKYLIMNLDSDRLKKVKQVSLDMLDIIDNICKKHNIIYYISGNDALYKANDTEEYAKIWRDDMTVLMDEENYNKFINIAPKELTHFYFLENKISNNNYHFPYSKLKLNYTYFRDRRTFPADVNQGLWINIGVLINTSDDPKEREKHFNDLSKIYDQIRLKWLYNPIRALNLKNKSENRYKEWQIAHKKSLKSLLAKQEKLINKYKFKNTKFYLESTTSLVPVMNLKKSVFKEGERLNYLDHSYIFPSNLQVYLKLNLKERNKMKKHLKDVKKLKLNNVEKYNDLSNNLTKKQEEKLNNKVSLFELGMYDSKDYRSGVYDMDL